MIRTIRAHLLDISPTSWLSEWFITNKVREMAVISPIAKVKLTFMPMYDFMLLRLMQLLMSWLWWSKFEVQRLQLRQCSVPNETLVLHKEQNLRFS